MTGVELWTNEDRIFGPGANLKPAPCLAWPAAIFSSRGRAQGLFADNGYLHLSKVFAEAQLESVVKGVGELFAQQLLTGASSKLEPRNILRADRRPMTSERQELSLQIEHAFRELPSLRSLIEGPEIRKLLAVLEIEAPMLLDDQCYLKPERNGGPIYLHRDSDFFGPLEVTTFWIALTKTDVNSGCLWFLPASHVRDDRAFGLVRRSTAPQGDPDIDRDLDFFYEVERSLEFAPAPCDVGDVILIHRNVLHASRRNSSAQARLSCLIEVIPVSSIDLYRRTHAGVFEYHDRVEHLIRLAL